MISQQRINELKRYNDPHKFFDAVLCEMSIIREHREVFEAKALEFGNKYLEYTASCKKRIDWKAVGEAIKAARKRKDIRVRCTTSNNPPRDKWKRISMQIEKDGLSFSWHFWVPPDFPDDPTNWFSIYNPSHYHDMGRLYEELLELKATCQPKDMLLRDYIALTCLFNKGAEERGEIPISPEILSGIEIQQEYQVRIYNHLWPKVKAVLIRSLEAVNTDLASTKQAETKQDASRAKGERKMTKEEYEEREIGYSSVKTPKELLEVINHDSEWKGTDLQLGDINDARQAAIKIRAENLSLNLRPVPSRGNISDIQNWCIDAQKILDNSSTPEIDLASTKQKENVITTGEITMVWDVFVCHASEDKKDFVQPLADALKNVGLKVWYDDFSLKTGDSLRGAIDKGLGRSQYGVVVISQSFLKKDWPQKELDGLVAREVNGKKIILPIWYKIDAETVREYSPTLAGRKAISMDLSVEQIVKKLLVDMEVKSKRKIGIDAFHGETWGGLTNLLENSAFELTRINSKVDTESLRPIKALIIATKGMNSNRGFDESEIDAIQKFVTSGGNLLCVDLAWSWVYPQYGNKPLEQFPLNVLGKRIGFCITGKNINLPKHFSTEIMAGINTIKRDKWAPSEIEFYGQKSQGFIMDDKDRIIAGIMPVGEGLVAVVGHRDLLVENPEIVIRILAYFAREGQWTARG